MIVIVLCGGIDKHLDDYSLPKPLNMIYGKPSIFYCLSRLPETINTIHFIVGQHLLKYNFTEIVINEFKTRKCVFHYLPYFTRGSIETAYIGTLDLENTDENVIFLDNDILYNFPDGLFESHKEAFIGFSEDTGTSESYSFIKLDNTNKIIDFKEKVRISNLFCCGVYGFLNISQFRQSALAVLSNESDLASRKELFLSIIFQNMINSGSVVRGIKLNNVYNIGSLKDLQQSWENIPKTIMRVCFDLDNTLVSYPVVPGDYTTVRPIEAMINLARQLHVEGHTVIIHTARRMKTHKHNIGAVIKDIGRITFDTLEKFNIPYNEIIFGKPIADIYIDDKGVNPYRNDLFSMGYIFVEGKCAPMNSLKPNKFNRVEVINDTVFKRGPIKAIRGEIYYYTHLPHLPSLLNYFPKYIDSSEDPEYGTLNIEHIKGVPVFTLYKSNLLTKDHINRILGFLDVLHTVKGVCNIKRENIVNNYKHKLIERFSCVEDYPFEDAESIQKICLERLELYIESPFHIVDFIHGDFWFSNIIIDFEGDLKMFDMRGQVDGILTTSGDKLYDYGKLYQSILGYDCILNDVAIPAGAKGISDHFETRVSAAGISLTNLRAVTFSLVIGNLPFIDCNDAKQRVWSWIKATFL